MMFNGEVEKGLDDEAWVEAIDIEEEEKKYDEEEGDHYLIKRTMDPNSSIGKICLGEDNCDKNLILNEFAIKLCLEHKVKNRDRVVKKELIVALRETAKFEDDWELILDGIDFGDILDIDKAKLPPLVCKMGKSARNKRRLFENHQINYFDEGSSLNNEKPLKQEEAAREAITIDIYKRFSILEEARPVIETMASSDKYKKILDSIFLDKQKLDGEIKKEEEETIKRVTGEDLKEKEDPGAFVIPIRLEVKIDLNTSADTGSDINVMPFRIYSKLGREEVKSMNRGITMLNHSKVEPMGLLKYVLCQVGVTTIIAKFLILDMPVDKGVPILVGR
ncbi:hypothetical protein Tco_0264355 [Tanacetum coccineum]